MHLPWLPVMPPGVDQLKPAFSSSIHHDEAIRLGKLANCRQVLEIGTAYGYAAVVMALEGAVVTTIDPHEQIPYSYEIAQANCNAYGIASRVNLLHGRSPAAVEMLSQSFDLVFIDGDHNQSSVVADIRASLRVLAPGGMLAVHDYGECCCPGVAVALDGIFPEGPDILTQTLWQKKI